MSLKKLTHAQTSQSSLKVIKQRVVGGKAQSPQEDYLAIEDPLEVTLAYQQNTGMVEKKLIVTMRTPGHDDELLHGFLYSEGIIQRASDIVEITYTGPKLSAAATQARVEPRMDTNQHESKSINTLYTKHLPSNISELH